MPAFADYLVLERDSEIKHEFDAGEILAMSGGTARHSALAARMIMALGNTCPPRCTVFTSDMRVREGNVLLASGPTFDLSVLYADLPL
jgi:Uma2 family endonuclease